MAAQRVFTQNDDEFFYYLGGSGLDTKEAAFNERISRFDELTGTGPVSPKVYKPLFNEDLPTFNESRVWIGRELSQIREQLELEPEGTNTRALLERLVATGTAAKNRYDDVFKQLLAVIIGSTPRVNWTKHTNNNALVDLAEWLQIQLIHFSGLVDDEVDAGMKRDLEAVYTALYKAATEVPALANILKQAPAFPAPAPAPAAAKASAPGKKPVKITIKKLPKTAGKKRPRDDDDDDDDDDGGDNTNNNNNNNNRRPNVAAPPGPDEDLAFARAEWWGPNNSKLHCPQSFYNIIREYREYLANPPTEPGSRQYRVDMMTFLRRAMRRAGLRDRLDAVLLKGEWEFREPNYQRRLLMSFLVDITEAEVRSGIYKRDEGIRPTEYHLTRRGTNHFKEMLGGGLSALEMDPTANPGANFELRAKLALTRLNGGHQLSLRGGGGHHGLFSLTDSEDDNDTSAAKRRETIRKRMTAKFRNPRELWNDVVADASYPQYIFNERKDSLRPPMIEPDRAGPVIDQFRAELTQVAEVTRGGAYTKIQDERNNAILNKKAEQFLEEGNRERAKWHNFLYNNITILPDEPKLNEEEGKNEEEFRYQGLQDADFASPMRYVFRARAVQVLRLAIFWKLYLAGERSLLELLSEERRLLQIWDEHEELYMEWENFRWFRLKSQYEKADLENRYQYRELLRTIWENEMNELDDSIRKLKSNAHYYDNPPTTPRRGFTPRPSSSHRTPAQPRFNKPQATPNPQQLPTPGTGTGTGGRARGKFVDLLGVLDESDSDAQARPLGTTPGRAPAPAPAPAPASGSKGKGPGASGYGVADGVRYLQTMRDAYTESVNAAIRANDDLDPLDPGSHAEISRNNVDIMAKQQVLWALESEIHNARRSVNPLAPGNIGRGAEHRWELPEQQVYMANTREIIIKKPLPLGDTSLGLGPMPGEHPKADDPRLFLGAHPSFGTNPDPREEMHLHPVGDSLFDGEPAGGAGPAQQTQQANTGVGGVGAVGNRALAGRAYAAQAGVNQNYLGQPVPQQVTYTPTPAYQPSPLPRPEGLYEMSTAVRQYGLDANLDNAVQLQQARDLVTKARDEYKAAGQKLEELTKAEAEAVAVVQTYPNDSALNKILEAAQDLKADAEEDHAEATAIFRVLGAALQAQQDWAEWEPEDPPLLHERFNVLTKNFNDWADEFDWDTEVKLTPRNAVDQWILDVASLMHETYKAIGINSGPAYWAELYRSFWETPAHSLWKMRAIWFQALIEDVNYQITASGGYPFIQTPPKPMPEWNDVLQPLDKLMQDAEYDLAQPLTPAPAAGGTGFDPRLWADPIPQIRIEPAQSLTPEEYQKQVKNYELLQEVRRKNPQTKRVTPRRSNAAQIPPTPPGSKPAVTVPTMEPGSQQRIREMLDRVQLGTSPVQPQTPSSKLLTSAVQGPTPVSSAPRPTTTSRPKMPLTGKVNFTPLPTLPSFKPAATPTATPKRPTVARQPVTPAPTPQAPKQQQARPAKRPRPAPQKQTTRPGPAPAPASATPKNQKQGGPPPAKKLAMTPAAGGSSSAPKPVPATAAETEEEVEDPRNDGWPDLKELLQVTWHSTLAHEALQQMPGDYTGVPKRPARFGFPKPVRKVTPQYYYDL